MQRANNMLWFWGASGAFIYAAPRLSACLFQNQHEDGRSYVGCFVEFVFAMAIGSIAAAAFSSSVQQILGRKSPDELRAVGAMLGLVANRVAPGVVELLNGRILRSLKGEKS